MEVQKLQCHIFLSHYGNKTESWQVSMRKLPDFYEKVGRFLKNGRERFGGAWNFDYICSTTISHILGSAGSNMKERDSLCL